MTGSASTNLEALRQRVNGDPVLQARLFALTDVQEFVVAVCHAGGLFDLPLSDADVQMAMRAGRQAWSDRKRS